jgi:hypothetical protein
MGGWAFRTWVHHWLQIQASTQSDDFHRFLIETVLRLLEQSIFTSID